MPDDIRQPGLTVAEALSRLPLEAPDRSAWPLLAARIHATSDRPRGPRWPFALAAAAVAVLALALVLPLRIGGPDPAAPAGPDAADLRALMQESAQLEALLASMSGSESGSASTLMLGLAFEDRLRELDATLAQPDLPADQQARLWQSRVALLRDYASLRGTEQWVAVQGGQLDGSLVATF